MFASSTASIVASRPLPRGGGTIVVVVVAVGAIAGGGTAAGPMSGQRVVFRLVVIAVE